MTITNMALSQSISRNSMVVSTKYYVPTNPSMIQILFEFPANYDIIGSIDVSKGVEFSKKAAKKKALKKAKKEAARLGANAIVLQGYDRDQGFLSDRMNLSALAIFVKPLPSDHLSDSSSILLQQKSTTDSELISLQKSINNPDDYNIGDKVVFVDEKRQCVGEIVEINRKKQTVILYFHHERSGNMLKTKRKFEQIKKFQFE